MPPPPSATLLPSDHVPLRDALVISPYGCAPVSRTFVSPETPSPAPKPSMPNLTPSSFPTSVPTRCRFIAALILPSSDSPGALAILDHAGELTLRAPLPADLHRDAYDIEGLLAHLTHFVPSLSAITDVFVSRLPTAADPSTPSHQASAPAICPSLARVLRFIAWLGPIPHFVAPATWLSHHGVLPGSTETLCQTCTRCLPGLVLSNFGPRMTDDVQAAVLLAHHARSRSAP